MQSLQICQYWQNRKTTLRVEGDNIPCPGLLDVFGAVVQEHFEGVALG